MDNKDTGKNNKPDLSPDLVDDQDTKDGEYNEVTKIMAALEETPGEDLVPDEDAMDNNTDDGPNKPGNVDSKTGSDEPDLENVDDFSETVDNKDKQDVKDKDAIIERLKEEIRQLRDQVNRLNHVKNVVDELGFSTLNQQELVAAFREIRDVSQRIISNPQVIEVIEKVGKGEIKLEGDEELPVSAFMPEGDEDEFDPYDAMNTPGSPSWEARKKWEDYNRQRELQKQQLMHAVNEFKSQVVDPQEMAKFRAMAEQRMSVLRRFAENQYSEHADELIESFRKALSTLDPQVLKVALVAHARKKGLKSKLERELAKNGSKFSPESEISRSMETDYVEAEPVEGDDKLKEWFID